MFRQILCAALVAAVCIPSAVAQDMQDAIVVTAARYSERYQSQVLPHVTLTRRADAATRMLTLSCDTREDAARRAELTEALRGLARLAGSGNVTLGILDEDLAEEGQTRIVPFSVERALELLRPGPRSDTSQVLILQRTPVSASDTIEAVEARLNAFQSRAPRPGRVEYQAGDVQLVLINPPQYRAALLQAIAADVNGIVAVLGQGYGARLEGLQNPIAWKRAGDLDLKLFVPYQMVVLPRNASAG